MGVNRSYSLPSELLLRHLNDAVVVGAPGAVGDPLVEFPGFVGALEVFEALGVVEENLRVGPSVAKARS